MTEFPKVINWIASYPKSGNTWVRFLLLNLIYGPQSSTEKLDALIPDIHKLAGQIKIPANSNVLIKTHFQLSATMPLFNHTAGFIYIIRNPIDTMMSNLNYAFTMHGIVNDPAVRDKIKKQYIEQFISNRGDPNWIRLGRGSWVENVTSWITNDPGFPNLVLKYEDMLADPVSQLGKISNFLKLRSSQAELQSAVNNSSFRRMKEIEEKELARKIRGFYLSENSEKSIAEGNRFMFRGKAGEGEKELTRSQRERFLEQFGPTIELAGYQL